jgi:hypothetical protein
MLSFKWERFKLAHISRKYGQPALLTITPSINTFSIRLPRDVTIRPLSWSTFRQRALRTDADHGSEVMPIRVPNGSRSLLRCWPAFSSFTPANRFPTADGFETVRKSSGDEVQ